MANLNVKITLAEAERISGLNRIQLARAITKGQLKIDDDGATVYLNELTRYCKKHDIEIRADKEITGTYEKATIEADIQTR